MADSVDGSNPINHDNPDNNDDDDYSLKSNGTWHSSYASNFNADSSNAESSESSNEESENSVVYVGSLFPVVASLSAASNDSLPIMCAPRNRSMDSSSRVSTHNVAGSSSSAPIIPLNVSGSSSSVPTIPLFPIFHPDSANATKRKREDDSVEVSRKKHKLSGSSTARSSAAMSEIVRDSCIDVQTITGHSSKDVLYKEATATISHAASPADIDAIEHMLEHGYGEIGHAHAKLEFKESRLGPTAGQGVFVKEDCEIRDGECICEYSGTHVHPLSVKTASIKQQLYNIAVDSVCINGDMEPINGHGFGSFVNSSVTPGYPSVVRFVVYHNRIFFMCNVNKRYPLRGGYEIYFTAGKVWWSLYDTFLKKK